MIDTEKALELKFRMLDVLSDIEVAQVHGVACAFRLGSLLVLKQEISSSCCIHVRKWSYLDPSQKVTPFHVAIGDAASPNRQ